MRKSLVRLRGDVPIGTGNAGLAADFLDLALRKARHDGTIALVLPLSAISGSEWERARRAIGNRCKEITIATIAGAGSYDSSFSADTGMAECLLVARRGKQEGEKRATFVMLGRRVGSANEADLLATEVGRIRSSGQMRNIESAHGMSSIAIGREDYGSILNAPIPASGPWPLVGIVDADLAQVAWNLEQGAFVLVGLPKTETIPLPIAPIGSIAGRGPYDLDIYWNQSDGTPRGPLI